MAASATAEPVKVCGGCRKAGACKLGVVREPPQGTQALFSVQCPSGYEGAFGAAHGGWTAAVFDECLASLPNRLAGLAVTARLAIRHLRPVPVGRPLQVCATVDRQEGSRWEVSGEMVLLPGRDVLAVAHGLWIARDAEHFDRHRDWLAGQDRTARST